MTKNKIKIVLCILQVVLIAILFLPFARTSGTEILSTWDIARRYSETGKVNDSLVYLFLAVCCPVVTALSLFLLHERRNFGVGACLSVLTALVHACFFSSVKAAMTGTISVTGLDYFLVFLGFASMALEIYGYLLVGPTEEADHSKSK